MTDFRQLTQDLASAPLGDLIAAVGRGVAEAQGALDAGSLEQTLALYDQTDDLQTLLREIGYRPTFYTIPQTEGELRLSLTVTTGTSGGHAVRPPGSVPSPSAAAPTIGNLSRLRSLSKVYATPVDSRYQNSYSFNSNVSATVKFSIVAVPPTSAAEAARVVPDLVGLTVGEAAALVESFDLRISVQGDDDGDGGNAQPDPSTEIASQSLPAGQLTSEGAEIVVTIASP